jgi:hypothetical protein
MGGRRRAPRTSRRARPHGVVRAKAVQAAPAGELGREHGMLEGGERAGANANTTPEARAPGTAGRSCAGGRTGPRVWPRAPSPGPCRPRSRPARARTGRTQPKLRQRAPEQDRPQRVAECAQPLRGQHQPNVAGQPLPAGHAGSRPKSCARRQCSFRPSNIVQVIESSCSSAATIGRPGQTTSSPDASGASYLSSARSASCTILATSHSTGSVSS